MTWLVAGAIFFGLLVLLPRLARASRRAMRGNGRLAGAALGFGLVFAYLFEPAKAAAIETLQTRKEARDEEAGWSGDNSDTDEPSRFERNPMRLMLIAAALAAPLPAAAAPDAGMTAVLAGPQRSAGNRARDRYRHPVETLAFFGLKPTMTVVEITPGGGWYTEILAPYLRDRGHYIAAGSNPATENGAKAAAKFKAKLDADPASYAKVTVTAFGKGAYTVAPPASADMVLSFREIHNYVGGGYGPEAFKAFFAALKPGGVLGVVEHRAPEAMAADREAKTGYMKVSTVKALAAAAGFKFAGASEVNANPKDKADYPEGVWTLPPTFQLGDVDRAKYAAIGESDRMTLKFVKP